MKKMHTNTQGFTKPCGANKRACRFSSENNSNGAHMMLEENDMQRASELEISRENGGTFGKGLSESEAIELEEIYTKGRKAFNDYENKEINNASDLQVGDVIAGTQRGINGKEKETVSSPVVNVESNDTQTKVTYEDGSYGIYDTDTPVEAKKRSRLHKGTTDKPHGIERVAGLEEHEIKGTSLKAGDVIKGLKFKESGSWYLDEVTATKVESYTPLGSYRRMMKVTTTDGKVLEYNAKSELTVYRKPEEENKYTYPEKSPREIYSDIKNASSAIRRGDGLDDESLDKLVETANNPSLDGMGAARLKTISESLEDHNRSGYSLLIDAAIERYELSQDSNRKVQRGFALLTDPRTPDTLYKQVVESASQSELRALKLRSEISGDTSMLRANDTVDWDSIK